MSPEGGCSPSGRAGDLASHSHSQGDLASHSQWERERATMTRVSAAPGGLARRGSGAGLDVHLPVEGEPNYVPLLDRDRVLCLLPRDHK
eukprot:6122499-Prymnesium_polylepis.1